MKGFELSIEEQQELHAALKSARRGTDPKIACKINALILLGTDWSLVEVSNALFLDEESLRKYAALYKENGLDAVLTTFYKGSPAKLSVEQQEQLKIELNRRIYLTTKEVCHFVECEIGVQYTISGMTDLLKRLGYVYKKPKVKPGKADPELQEEFLQYYRDFMKNKGKTEAIFFMDAVHPVHNSMPACGWMKKGEDTVLKTNSGRQRLNIHGAMNAETFEVIPLISDGNVNGDSTIQLLSFLEELYPLATLIYVILDNARYHYSAEVQEWESKSRVKLVFLPSYSPELNLIERLWKVFKKNVLYNKYYETISEFKEACFEFFTNQDQHYGEISSIMGAGLEFNEI